LYTRQLFEKVAKENKRSERRRPAEQYVIQPGVENEAEGYYHDPMEIFRMNYHKPIFAQLAA